MNMLSTSRHRLIALASVTSLALFATAGCASSSNDANSPSGSAAAEAEASVERIDSIAALLPKEYIEDGSITIAAIAGQAPMMFVGEGTAGMTGVEADILHAIGGVLGVDIELEETKADAFMAGIVSDRFDGAAGSITYTAERAEQADFVVYAHYGQALLGSADGTALTFDSLCGHSVGILTGSVQQTKFVPQLDAECAAIGEEAVKTSAYPDPNALVLAVQSGRVEAGFVNQVNALYQADHSDGALSVFDTGFGDDPKGIILNRNSGISEAVAAAVSALHDDGTLQEIFDKWSLDSVMTESVDLNPALS